MEAMEQKLNAILEDPSAMQKIMEMAKSLGAESGSEGKITPEAPPPGTPDLAMLQKLSGMMGAGTIDADQRALLKALHPYLSQRRLHKLENAMRAAKMARIAVSALLPRDAGTAVGR